MSKKQHLYGIRIMGALIILSTLGQMWTLHDVGHYHYLFQDLPEGLIQKRFVLSWSLRIIGLLAGIGILFFREAARKAVILIFGVTIIGVKVKVSHDSFRRLAELLDKEFHLPGVFLSRVGEAVFFGRLIEILVAAFVIFYFTRPQVRRQFRLALRKKPLGLLEPYLSEKRARKAGELMPGRLSKGTLLDIGCDAHAHFLSQTSFKTKYGLDRIDRLASSDRDIHLINRDLETGHHLPFENESVEAVTMLAVYEHLKPETVQRVLEEVYRILKPEGRLILTIPSPWSEPILKIMAFFELVDPLKIDEHHGMCLSHDVVKRLKRAGFQKEKIRFGYFECFLNRWFCIEK